MHCQHGPAECRLDRVIACATHLHPDRAAWLPFVLCLEGGRAAEREQRVDGCAAGAGLDADALLACAEGPQGAELERAAEAETAALIPQHKYVPWVVVNGIALMDDYPQLARYVCVAYTGQRPQACYVPAGAAAVQLRAASHRKSASAAAS